MLCDYLWYLICILYEKYSKMINSDTVLNTKAAGHQIMFAASHVTRLKKKKHTQP